jgi:hypothetical protein
LPTILKNVDELISNWQEEIDPLRDDFYVFNESSKRQLLRMLADDKMNRLTRYIVRVYFNFCSLNAVCSCCKWPE